jgi:photosystem II stability/assembly factor-like uncharacterized protein
VLPLVVTAACTGVGGAGDASPSGDAGGTVVDGWTLSITSQPSGTEALLQAVSPVSDSVAWIAGHEATYAVTTDGGRAWSVRTVPDAEGLQFRDVAAFDESVAYLMSAGPGDQSRIYRTDDGGAAWTLQYVADDPDAFLDCIDFWSVDRGLAYGDAIDAAPFILETSDGGVTWSRVPADALPPALDGEGGFAASGTCLVTGDGGRAWIATGNAARARILRTADYGASWSAVNVPVVGGPAAGLATVAVEPSATGFGVALGGVIGEDSIRTDNVTVTADGGRSWSTAGPLAMEGPVYGSSLVPGARGLVVAVGPRGLDWSSDAGASWSSADTATWWAVAFSSTDAGWAVGPGGRIARLGFLR